jgi:hypothetical protein
MAPFVSLVRTDPFGGGNKKGRALWAWPEGLGLAMGKHHVVEVSGRRNAENHPARVGTPCSTSADILDKAGSPSRPPASLPQRPGRGAANPHSVPAGGTTAGQPDPSTPKEAAWMADVVLWHLLCQ